jgi:hypothetical protein
VNPNRSPNERPSRIDVTELAFGNALGDDAGKDFFREELRFDGLLLLIFL